MTRDRRYHAVRSMIEDGSIAGFREIFEIIPKTLVSKDLGMNYQTFTRKVAEPDLFSLRELAQLAALAEISLEELVRKVINDLKGEKKKG